MYLNEIRIGNYLQGKDCIHIVKEIGDNYYTSEEGSILLRDAKPILLTDYWILKFELNKRDNYIILTNDILLTSNYEPIERISLYSIRKPLKYVHVLQNLFYALEGKEIY